MSLKKSAFVLAASLVAYAGTAGAQQTPAEATGGFGATPSQQIGNTNIGPLFSPPFGADHLFGDWGGARSYLEKHGINLLADYLTENFGNVSGGRNGRKGFEYVGQVGVELDLDFGKIAGLNGLSTHTIIVQRAGRNLSADYLGDNLATVQEIYGGGGNVLAHFVYTYAELALLNNRVDIIAGRYPVGTFFAASPLYCAFVNVLTCGNPHPLPNYPGEPDWPASTWDGQIRVSPTLDTYAMVGAFQVNPNFGGRSGFSFGKSGTTGVSIPIEVGYVPRFGSNSLVGHYKLGYDYDSSRYPDLLQDGLGNPFAVTGNAPRSHHGRNEFYALVDQMLLRTGKADTDGVIALAGFVHADRAISPLADHAYAGALTSASVIGRPQDSFGAIYHWIHTSGSLSTTQQLQLARGSQLGSDGIGGTVFGVQGNEQVVEVQYTANVFRGVTVEPDFQYIIRPGATSNSRDAAVLGFRTNIQF